MREALLLVAIAALGAIGLGLIALSQKQHWRLVRPADAAHPTTALRLAGALAIGLAALAAVWRDGLAFGLLLWATMLTLAALPVVAGLAKLNARGDPRRQGP